MALSSDTKTLDPDHELNVWARNNKVGLTPNVLQVNREEQYAIIGLGAVMAVTALPLGWFAADDGRRALIFDEQSAVQVELSLADAGELSPEQILQSIHAQMQGQFPDVQHIVFGKTAGSKRALWRVARRRNRPRAGRHRRRREISTSRA